MRAAAEPVRVALYHTELDRDGPGLLLRDILEGEDQVEAVVRVIRAADADVLVLAGIDYDLTGVALDALAEKVGGYPHRFSARPNRGLPTGRDVDGNGRLGDPDDAHGYAVFQGQGGMAILSRLPIDTDAVRDHSGTRWTRVEGHIAPDGTDTDQRLSTTVHWDVPVLLGDRSLGLLVWHATPPVFDGPEDRNGRRNHDEAAFWLDRLDQPGPFVLTGVANLDVEDGDGRPAALRALLDHAMVRDPKPSSVGGTEAALTDGGVNARQRGDPALDTADWRDDPGWPGNLRVDYVLPSAGLTIVGAGVLWPAPETSLGRDVERASRHGLVWVDVEMPERRADGG